MRIQRENRVGHIALTLVVVTVLINGFALYRAEK